MENRTQAQYTCPPRFLEAPPTSFHGVRRTFEWPEVKQNQPGLGPCFSGPDENKIHTDNLRNTNGSILVNLPTCVLCSYMHLFAFKADIANRICHILLLVQISNFSLCKMTGDSKREKPWHVVRERHRERRKKLYILAPWMTPCFLHLEQAALHYYFAEPWKAHGRSCRHSECWSQCEQTDKNVYFHGSDILVGRQEISEHYTHNVTWAVEKN